MMNDERITGKDEYAREVLGILSDLSSQTYVSIDVILTNRLRRECP